MRAINKEKFCILLYGPPGVGKSTVGKVMGEEFGLTFFDGDDEMNEEERKKVSSGEWSDNDRRKLLVRKAKKINNLYEESNVGIVTAAAMTKRWMREFLSNHVDPFLQFVLVMTLLKQAEMERLVQNRHQQGHPISLEAFCNFTDQFDPPNEAIVQLNNPHDLEKKQELIEEIAKVLKQLRSK